ncbi:MAG: glycosyltransferase, partial [Deltaproteobacteria bacterium]|nr:glycosyltransferase [Deltaproteobacteria bacterium]
MKSPAISVIIPTYNRAGLLARAVDSVLNQTFQDFELIVVADGSTDRTAEVLAAYQDRLILL